jgi:hypothetical protein
MAVRMATTRTGQLRIATEKGATKDLEEEGK